MYEAVNPDDIEAEALIDFLGFNDNVLVGQRIAHINTLKTNQRDSGYTSLDMIAYLRNNPLTTLSYVTAIEAAFDIDLSQVIEALSPPFYS